MGYMKERYTNAQLIIEDLVKADDIDLTNWQRLGSLLILQGLGIWQPYLRPGATLTRPNGLNLT